VQYNKINWMNDLAKWILNIFPFNFTASSLWLS
jgi:hypothetical protein